LKGFPANHPILNQGQASIMLGLLRSIRFMKVFHSLVSFILVGSVFYTLYTALADRISPLTWLAFSLTSVEIGILILSGWKCPLTSYTESLGAKEGSVTRLFLPEFLAKNLFLIFRILYLLSILLLVARICLPSPSIPGLPDVQ